LAGDGDELMRALVDFDARSEEVIRRQAWASLQTSRTWSNPIVQAAAGVGRIREMARRRAKLILKGRFGGDSACQKSPRYLETRSGRPDYQINANAISGG
jgi:hypothetical protein